MRALLVAVILTGGCSPFDSSSPDASTGPDLPIGPTGCGGLIPTGGTCEPGYTCHYEDWEHGCSCACTVEGRLACSNDTVGSICATGGVSAFTPRYAIDRANTESADELAPTVRGDELELLYVGPTADLWSAIRDPLDAFEAGEQRTDLSTSDDEHDPELAADGLSVLFVRAGSIVIATRASTTSAWASASPVPELAGFGAPGLGANDLHIVLAKNGALYEATRATTTASWSTPSEITELADAADDGGPSLSRGGLELVFHSNRSGTYQLWRTERAALDQPFAEPVPIELGIATANVRDPELSRDGLDLYYATDVEGTQDLYLATRSAN